MNNDVMVVHAQSPHGNNRHPIESHDRVRAAVNEMPKKPECCRARVLVLGLVWRYHLLQAQQ